MSTRTAGVSATSFYSSTSPSDNERIEKLNKLEQNISSSNNVEAIKNIMFFPLHSSFLLQDKWRLFGPSKLCKYFSKQEEAIRYSLQDDDLSVFSMEVARGGERRFLVCSKETFWTFYKRCLSKHYYEVIPKHKRCKLYFDLEFVKLFNPEKDGLQMTERLVQMVNTRLQQHFSCHSYTEDVLVLESSNEKKFSIHLIFCSAVFHNNGACGTFVRRFLRDLSEEEKRYFQVKDSDTLDSVTSFIDCSVYSKNRNFRLYLSRKFGKKAALELSTIDVLSLSALENNSWRSGPDDEDLQRFIFLKSLITNTDARGSVLDLQEDEMRETERNNNGRKVETVSTSETEPSPYPEVRSEKCKNIIVFIVKRRTKIF